MEGLWSIQDVAEYLQIPVKTLYQWRCQGIGPKGRRVGRYVRYHPQAVRDWFDSVDDVA
ncbi:MAG: helix-turn-helix domain-containing protein [Actinomycetota bacterium]|nr:helix-turn-helix domain-containing protein [Actinomycetota bacterium]